MKLRAIANGNIIEVDDANAVHLRATGLYERVAPDPEEEATKSAGPPPPAPESPRKGRRGKGTRKAGTYKRRDMRAEE